MGHIAPRSGDTSRSQPRAEAAVLVVKITRSDRSQPVTPSTARTTLL
jgi:hypothetical protein